MKNLMVVCILLVPVIGYGAVIHVPTDALTIQEAIDLSSDGDTILIADGVYYGPGNREIEGRGKSIRITSENGSNLCLIHGGSEFRAFFFHEAENQTTIVEGLTLMHCAVSDDSGGAVACVNASPVFLNCRFLNNETVDFDYDVYGGAVSCENSHSIFQDCVFQSNKAKVTWTGIAYGGAIGVRGGQITVIDCVFVSSRAEIGEAIYCSEYSTRLDVQGCIFQDGGIYSEGPLFVSDCVVSASSDYGISVGGASAEIVNCRISENDSAGIYIHTSNLTMSETEIRANSSGYHSAGMMAFNSTAVITNCSIIDNTFEDSFEPGAGGLYFRGSNVQLINCTIASNTSAGSIGGALVTEDSAVSIKNSILWDNSPEQIYVSSGSAPEVEFSNIQGGFPGESVIDLDPLFISGPDGMYYLSQISAGQSVDSPCLDAGNAPAENICYQNAAGLDVCLNERTTRTDGIFDQGTVDLGFHFSITTSTPTPTPTSYVSPTITPTPVATPLNVKVLIEMPSNLFQPGDTCFCRAVVVNQTDRILQNYPLFVVLNVVGALYFAPAFSTTVDNYLDEFPEFQKGSTTVSVIPEFLWPEGPSAMEGLTWYGILTNPEKTEICGEIGLFAFGWTDH